MTDAEPDDTSPDPTRSPLRRVATAATAIAAVALVWGAVQAAGISFTPFHTRGEPREAVVVQDVLRNGDWILPRRNGQELPQKPPLFYWLGALTARLRGTLDETTVRIPSAVMSGAASLLIAGVAAALYGGVAGIVTGVALLTSFEWLRAATSARVDMTLAFGLTLVFVALLRLRSSEQRAWLVLFYIGCVWATLSKGIPGLVIPAFAVVLICALLDRSMTFLRRLRPVTGLLVVLVITGAWYAAAATRGGRPFLSIVLHENVIRAVGAAHFTLGHRHTVGYLVAALLAGLLPWTVLLPSVALVVWRDRRQLARSDARVVAILWIGAVFVPYALAASKRGVYLLPLYPAVCLLIGWWASRLVHGAVMAPWLRRVLTPTAWVLAGLLGLVAFAASAQVLDLPLLDAIAGFLDPRAAADVRAVAAADLRELAIAGAVAALAAVALACAAVLQRWGAALAAMVICTSAVIAAVTHVILPAVATAQTRRTFVGALRNVVAEPAELYTTPSLDYGTLFYWGTAVPEYDGSTGAPRPRYLLAPKGMWLHMPAAERQAYERIPGLRVARSSNQGDVVVLQRIVPTGNADNAPHAP
jgi:4-amino-4-deoxy-L-arabinose transferase-like glycosyltransferase